MKVLRALIPFVLLSLLAACAHAPDGPGALTAGEHMRLASIYEAKGEIDLAARHLEASIKANAGRPEAHFALGNLNLKLGRYSDAERSYLKALTLDPNNAALYNNLGWLYMETDRLARAEKMAQKAIKLGHVDRYVFLDTLGVIQTRAGKYTEAEESLSQAMEQAPLEETGGLIKIYNHLLDLYRETGDEEKAVEVEERLKAAFSGPE